MEKKSYKVLGCIVDDLNHAFYMLENFTLEDHDDLDLLAEEELTPEEYKRFNAMLNVVIKTK